MKGPKLEDSGPKGILSFMIWNVDGSKLKIVIDRFFVCNTIKRT